MGQEGEGALGRLLMPAVDIFENSAVAEGGRRTCPEPSMTVLAASS